MSATTHRLAIMDGPAADIIWTAAQYAYSPNVKVTVDFRLRRPTEAGESKPHIFPKITGVTHEDGSGQSLIIVGYLDGKHFTGYYHARSREGHLLVSL